MSESTEQATGALAGIVREDEALRLSLLFVHGLYACSIGTLFFLAADRAFTTQSFVWLRAVPGGHHTAGALLIASGLLLLGGLIFGRRRMVQAVALSLIAAWDLMLAAGFAYAYVSWTAASGASPTLYPVAVYAHLGTIMSFHVVRLIAWMRGARRLSTPGGT